MTPTLRVVLIVVSILTTFMIMRKIRQSKLQIEDSIFCMCGAIRSSRVPVCPQALRPRDVDEIRP